MDNALVALKVITAATGLVGYLSQIVILTPEIRDDFIYKGRNPLYGDLIKYTIYAINFCLFIRALCPWWKVSATPMWAWASVGFSGLVLLLYFLESGASSRVKSLVLALPIRVGIALLITHLTQLALASTNA
ncbi:hypothetical protein [Thermomonas haemolytica]|uniref:hypothetical protein n=1 Tax=Thermomonas haemolytica TaxID=141949 RepID=UPI001043E35F|nr:hypothetical protein [Thermomonas haemolytica]